MTLKTQYRIYLVSYPFENSNSLLVRPMLALTDPTGNDNLVILAPISSGDMPLSTNSYVLLKEHLDFLGLKEPSVLHLYNIITLPVEKLKRELGYVPKHLRQEIQENILKMFGL